MTIESRQLEKFWNFLGAWFPDADLEGIDDDEDVVRSFIGNGNATEISDVYGGCKQVLRLPTLPWERISEESNRFFENESHCREWLISLTDLLAQVVDAASEE